MPTSFGGLLGAALSGMYTEQYGQLSQAQAAMQQQEAAQQRSLFSINAQAYRQGQATEIQRLNELFGYTGINNISRGIPIQKRYKTRGSYMFDGDTLVASIDLDNVVTILDVGAITNE